MAYVGSDLQLMASTMETPNFAEFVYKNSAADSSGTIAASSFFSDGVKRGGALGSIVWVMLAGVPTLYYISTVTGSAFTVTA